MPSSRTSCAAACVIARAACAPADQRPRPGIARRAEPPVTWISVPPSPDSRSARMPVERNTKDCSATAAAQPRKPSSVASAIGPPPKPLPSSGRPARAHGVHDQARRSELVAHACERGPRVRPRRSRRPRSRARRARSPPPRSPRCARRRRRASRSAEGGRSPRRRGCARRGSPPLEVERGHACLAPASQQFVVADGAEAPGRSPGYHRARRDVGSDHRGGSHHRLLPYLAGGKRIALVPILLARRTRMPGEAGSTASPPHRRVADERDPRAHDAHLPRSPSTGL